MSMAKRSMPELTDDELLEMAMDDFNAATEEWYERDGLVLLYMESEARERDAEADAEAAADDAAAERKHPHADPHCRYCLGSGIVRDWVSYGSDEVPMGSTCDCVEVDEDGN